MYPSSRVDPKLFTQTLFLVLLYLLFTPDIYDFITPYFVVFVEFLVFELHWPSISPNTPNTLHNNRTILPSPHPSRKYLTIP